MCTKTVIGVIVSIEVKKRKERDGLSIRKEVMTDLTTRGENKRSDN